MNKAYNLRESTTTKQLHIFKTKKSKINGCSDEAIVSVCQEININDTYGIRLSCLLEKEIRLECAKIGKHVCENCISNLNEE